MIFRLWIAVNLLGLSNQLPIGISNTSCYINAIKHDNIDNSFPHESYTVIVNNTNSKFIWESSPAENSNWEYPVVDNLNDIIAPFGFQSCFILLDNYMAVNFQPLDSPVVLRRLELAEVTTRRHTTDSRTLQWIPTGIFPRASVVTSNCTRFENAFWQYKSIYATRINIEDSLSALDLLTFAPKSKPWNCEMHLHLYLPISQHAEQQGILPAVFDQHQEQFYRQDQNVYLFGSVPSVKIHVMQQIPLKNLNSQFRYVVSRSLHTPHAAHSTVFVVAMVTNDIENLSFETLSKIRSTYVLKGKILNSKTVVEDSLQLDDVVAVPAHLVFPMSSKTLSALASPHTDDHILWAIYLRDAATD